LTAREPKKPPPKKRGPKAERLVLDGDWEAAVSKALQKPRPETTPKKRSS
jgi:hypothetical protein